MANQFVGEREERLREENAQLRDELRALRPVLDEVKPRPDELIARVDAALASSPSPPDREDFVGEEKAVDYPYKDGDVLVLGPEVFVSSDGTVICWKGQNYERQPDSDVLEPEDFRDPAVGRGDES